MTLVSSGRILKASISKSLCFLRYSSSLRLENYNDNYISVTFDNVDSTHTVKFNNVFLRDSCTSVSSRDPFSKQKLFSTSDISHGLSLHGTPKIVNTPDNEDCLEVTWSQNGSLHKSKYSSVFLEGYSSNSSIRKGKYFNNSKIIWDNNRIMKNISDLQVTYSDYAEKNSLFVKTLNNLNQFGLSFINDIPSPLNNPKTQVMNEDNALKWPVAALASKFGYIKKTFYGTLFDVRNEKEAKNIANTNTFLPLHMDLLYYESPPGLQLLHFIQNSTLGGENIFCDSFAAAIHVRNMDPQAYLALTKIPITYHYDNNNEHYYYARPLIVEENFNSNANVPAIKEVNYSPPFQGPFEVGTFEDNSSENVYFKDFLRGFKLFTDFVNDPINQYEIKMKEGSCAIFDNRRVLHSRKEFSDENGGDRWLMGCYVDADSFRSKLRIGNRSLEK
ncbi:DEHA2C03322p [Debaryomyces hansenii CBS767]|uniref:DEHA2C03322p n=1 Tax=Debaryomyces hansenii (strain ATCC 36239 / CBS 767 / BCRC 21394 / JCM 1990 / NBRC 0083 / IGC 2968) TaxID=284592 RepID=Q6BVE2_DEBHA|nr:DEHA2C03322p [Debaryomyces hansenii CBS767]CAG85872.2 DEHA2C03322p [Debaryomyces hansenii CBS767]|eukprot:XP_457827.2 DEHA2C03322p [Debaryomyces hansenii CBS767]